MSSVITDLAAALQAKDAAYLERNRCVALLARMALVLGLRAGLARTDIDGWSPEWHGCVYIDLPTGQVSWHYHETDAHLFAGLPAYAAHWDGHNTPEKYRRVADAFPVGEQLPPVDAVPLQPGDMLLVSTTRHLSKEQAMGLRDHIATQLANRQPVMVIAGLPDLQLRVLQRPTATQPTEESAAWNKVRAQARALAPGRCIDALLTAVVEYGEAAVDEYRPPAPVMGGRESVDDALAVVESFGPGTEGLNDTYARQILLAAEVKRLRALLNTPELHDFAKGVVLEAAHQRQRWSTDHDAGKAPPDWFWLLGYLAGKALNAAMKGDTQKALHHTISSAAALANWHAALSGSSTAMRPSIEPVAQGIEVGLETQGPAA